MEMEIKRVYGEEIIHTTGGEVIRREKDHMDVLEDFQDLKRHKYYGVLIYLGSKEARRQMKAIIKLSKTTHTLKRCDD